jgi:thiaminase/transcriptional activator TenA
VAIATVTTRHSDRLCEVAKPVWDTILDHPFLQELQAGTLPEETFRFYIQQDWLYILSRVGQWSITAGRCVDLEARRALLDWIEKVARLEPAAFHFKHAAALNLDLAHPDWEMSEANWAYTSHELAAVHAGTTAEALAALLPCPWVYRYVGEHLRQSPRPAHPIYADWIDFYGSVRGDPQRGVLADVYDAVAATADPATLARCERNFLISSRYEWRFWDAAYRREMWPV